jgi:uncharacterized membrane protein YuzA (DUF378 family)
VAVAGERHERREKKNVRQGSNINTVDRGPRGSRRNETSAIANAPAARHFAEVFVWLSIVLVVMLGLSGALVGLLGVDVIELVFGDMTPAARVVYAVLGAAAVYCAIAVALSHPFRRAGVDGPTKVR